MKSMKKETEHFFFIANVQNWRCRNVMFGIQRQYDYGEDYCEWRLGFGVNLWWFYITLGVKWKA